MNMEYCWNDTDGGNRRTRRETCPGAILSTTYLRWTDQGQNMGPQINLHYIYTGLFISPSGTSELDCATTKTDTAERSISIGRESLKVFFLY